MQDIPRVMKETWSSHVPVHRTLFELSKDIKGVVEIGAGLYSTPLFFELCKNVVSIETDKEWVDQLEDELTFGKKHRLIYHKIPDNIARPTRRHEVSQDFLDDSVLFWKKHIKKSDNYLFVDCISSLRFEAISRLQDQFDYVVFHDYNPRGLKNHYCDGSFEPNENFDMYVDQTYTQHTAFLVPKGFDEEKLQAEHAKQVQNFTPGKKAKLVKW